MPRSEKILTIVLIVLTVLTAGYYFIGEKVIMPPPKGEKPPLVEFDPEEVIDKVEFHRKNDAVKDVAAVLTSTPNGKIWELTAPMKKQANQYLFAGLKDLFSAVDMQVPADIDDKKINEFDLNDPAFRVTLWTTTGRKLVLKVGREPEAYKNYYYIMNDDVKSRVYLIFKPHIDNTFGVKLEEMRAKELFPRFPQGIEHIKIKANVATDLKEQFDIDLKGREGWFIPSLGETADENAVGAFLQFFAGAYADSYIPANQEKAQLVGLVPPRLEVFLLSGAGTELAHFAASDVTKEKDGDKESLAIYCWVVGTDEIARVKIDDQQWKMLPKERKAFRIRYLYKFKADYESMTFEHLAQNKKMVLTIKDPRSGHELTEVPQMPGKLQLGKQFVSWFLQHVGTAYIEDFNEIPVSEDEVKKDNPLIKLTFKWKDDKYKVFYFARKGKADWAYESSADNKFYRYEIKGKAQTRDGVEEYPYIDLLNRFELNMAMGTIYKIERNALREISVHVQGGDYDYNIDTFIPDDPKVTSFQFSGKDRRPDMEFNKDAIRMLIAQLCEYQIADPTGLILSTDPAEIQRLSGMKPAATVFLKYKDADKESSIYLELFQFQRLRSRVVARVAGSNLIFELNRDLYNLISGGFVTKEPEDK